MRLHKEHTPIARKLRKQGWTISLTGGGHVLWMSPTGERIIGALTPGGGRGDRNLKAKLKQAGADL